MTLGMKSVAIVTNQIYYSSPLAWSEDQKKIFFYLDLDLPSTIPSPTGAWLVASSEYLFKHVLVCITNE